MTTTLIFHAPTVAGSIYFSGVLVKAPVTSPSYQVLVESLDVHTFDQIRVYADLQNNPGTVDIQLQLDNNVTGPDGLVSIGPIVLDDLNLSEGQHLNRVYEAPGTSLTIVAIMPAAIQGIVDVFVWGVTS